LESKGIGIPCKTTCRRLDYSREEVCNHREENIKMSSKISIVAVLLLSLSMIPAIALVQAQSPDFSLTAISFSLLFEQGLKGIRNTTFNVTSLNGFTGTISFTITPVPTGYSTKINPTSVPLSTGARRQPNSVTYNGDPADCTGFRMAFTATGGGLVQPARDLRTARFRVD